MAAITKSGSNEKRMADEDLHEPEESPQDQPKAQKARDEKAGDDKSKPLNYAREGQSSGYFTIYKKGQGYWTRMGTVFGAILIGALTAYNLFVLIPTFLPSSLSQQAGKIAGLVTAVFTLAYVWFCWRLLNKPTNADFLITTDSEMKKVNWTSRRELIGSTRIVVIFMFLVAFFLFAVDWIFGTLMYLIHVLSVPPWGV